MSVTHNHRGYEARLAFAKKLLSDEFGLHVNQSNIVPIQYDEKLPFKYNNFIYRVGLDSPIASGDKAQTRPLQPGCTAIPPGTTDLILRLTNSSADGMSTATRVEKEIAVMLLASQALSEFVPHIVPAVYGWSSAAKEGSQGWMIQKFMPGTPADEVFMPLGLEKKKGVLAQMATIVKALQDFKLPETITALGGLTFDDRGSIVSAEDSMGGLGPWASYQESFESRFKSSLKQCDDNTYIQGWRASGVRDRLDKVVATGLPAYFEGLGLKDTKTLVHCDLTTNNLLIDPKSNRITALLDFDFSSISHPASEFFRSFHDIEGNLPGPSADPTDQPSQLRNAMLHGFPSPLPPTEEHGVRWELAKAWDDELEKLGAVKPRTIAGLDKVSEMETLLQHVLPWRLSNQDILKLRSEDVLARFRDEGEKQLSEMLSRLGF